MLAPIMTRLTGPFIAGRTWLFVAAVSAWRLCCVPALATSWWQPAQLNGVSARSTGFTISASQQAAYDEWVAQEVAH
jgi:hypothetical protein